MPIRKSTVPHDQAFQVHRIERAARLELVDPVPATPTETDVGPGGRDKMADVAKGEACPAPATRP